MAKQRIAGIMQKTGKEANVVWFRRNGETITRAYVIPTNKRYRLQMLNRVALSNVVMMYESMSSAIRGAFETKATRESDYNAFVRRNKVGYGAGSNAVPRTKDEVLDKMPIIDTYTISDGSLPVFDFRVASKPEESNRIGSVKGTFADASAALQAQLDGAYGVDAPAMGLVASIVWYSPSGHVYSKTVTANYNESASSLAAKGFVVTGEGANGQLSLTIPAEALTDGHALVVYASRKTPAGKILTSFSSLQLDDNAEAALAAAKTEAKWEAAINSYGWNSSVASRDAAEPADE